MIVVISEKLPIHSFKIRCTIGPIRVVIGINNQQIVGYSLAVHRYSECFEYWALTPYSEMHWIRNHQSTSMGNQVMGFCLKCKTYCQIANAREIVMSNGRTRMAGNCSNRGCDGKISKIVSW